MNFTSCDFRSSDAYNSAAEKLEQEGRYLEAISLLDKAIEKNPKNIYALTNRGVDKSILGDYYGAIEDYTEIIKIDSDNALAFLNRGKNKRRLKDYQGAIEDFAKAIKTKGNEMFYLDRIENAFVETGFDFDVSMEEIRFERGIAYYHIDSLNSSFNDFNFCIQKKFELPESFYHRGLIYISFGDSEKGCVDLYTADQLNYQYAKESIDLYCTIEK